ncbi:MAG: bifunctional DNA primase/polymerase, partial [Pseudonocardiaceae bacterium]
PGQHNSALCRAAYALGQLVGAQLLAEPTARTELTTAAAALVNADCDCTSTEVDRVITSGLAAGVRNPRRTVPRTSPWKAA